MLRFNDARQNSHPICHIRTRHHGDRVGHGIAQDGALILTPFSSIHSKQSGRFLQQMKADEAPVAATHDIDARGVDARLLAHKRVNRIDDIIHLNASDVTAETVEERIAIAEGAVVVRHQHRVARNDQTTQSSPVSDAAQGFEVVHGIEDIVGSPVQLDNKRKLVSRCGCGIVKHALATVLRPGGEDAVGEKGSVRWCVKSGCGGACEERCLLQRGVIGAEEGRTVGSVHPQDETGVERGDEVNRRVVDVAEKRRKNGPAERKRKCGHLERNSVAHPSAARETVHHETGVKRALPPSQGYDPSSRKGFVGMFAINMPV